MIYKIISTTNDLKCFNFFIKNKLFSKNNIEVKSDENKNINNSFYVV